MSSRIQAVVLLAGAIKPSPLVAATRRSPLDLPLANGRSLLSMWVLHTQALARVLGRDQLPLRIAAGGVCPRPAADGPFTGEVTIDEDQREYRGPGGVLRDLACKYGVADGDYLLVASAAQMLIEPLADLALDLASLPGDAAIVAHGDGTPSGAMLLRAGCLSEIAAQGFVDLKEQALPAIAARHRVRVVPRPHGPVGMPLRNLADYISAMRRSLQVVDGHTQDGSALPAGYDRAPFAERWRPVGSIIEPDAEVHPTARLYDSIALRGSRVERGARIVRSVACRGGVVRSNQTVADRFVTGEPVGLTA